MIAKTAIAAALISLATLTTAPAQASGITVEFGFGPGHGYGWNQHGPRHDVRRHRLSTNEVRWILGNAGYRQIQFFDNRGPVYQVRARKHGQTFFLVVSARNGEILSRNRI